MARIKVDNKLNVVIGTKAQVVDDTTIPDNSIVIVTDEELTASDIPNLDTGKITTGTLGVARGGTGRTDGYAMGVVETRASVLTKIWTGTQAQYDAIVTKDVNTLYFITE